MMSPVDTPCSTACQIERVSQRHRRQSPTAMSTSASPGLGAWSSWASRVPTSRRSSSSGAPSSRASATRNSRCRQTTRGSPTADASAALSLVRMPMACIVTIMIIAFKLNHADVENASPGSLGTLQGDSPPPLVPTAAAKPQCGDTKRSPEVGHTARSVGPSQHGCERCLAWSEREDLVCVVRLHLGPARSQATAGQGGSFGNSLSRSRGATAQFRRDDGDVPDLGGLEEGERIRTVVFQ